MFISCDIFVDASFLYCLPRLLLGRLFLLRLLFGDIFDAECCLCGVFFFSDGGPSLVFFANFYAYVVDIVADPVPDAVDVVPTAVVRSVCSGSS